MPKFNTKTLMETIINTEERVADFYEGLVKNVKEERGIKLLHKMAKDEVKHAEIYKNVLSKLPLDGEIEMSEEDIEYTQVLLDLNIFANINEMNRFSKSDALTLAEKIETDSILFYTHLMSIMPGFAAAELKIILAQEKLHLKYVRESTFLATISHLGL